MERAIELLWEKVDILKKEREVLRGKGDMNGVCSRDTVLGILYTIINELNNDILEDVMDKLEDDSDMVNHPDHYNKGGIETIDLIKMALSEEEFQGYLKGNVLKYKFRAPYKGQEDEDHSKAKVYYDWLGEPEVLPKGDKSGSNSQKDLFTSGLIDGDGTRLKVDLGEFTPTSSPLYHDFKSKEWGSDRQKSLMDKMAEKIIDGIRGKQR